MCKTGDVYSGSEMKVFEQKNKENYYLAQT